MSLELGLQVALGLGGQSPSHASHLNDLEQTPPALVSHGFSAKCRRVWHSIVPGLAKCKNNIH